MKLVDGGGKKRYNKWVCIKEKTLESVHKAYEPLLCYLKDIMHRLQNQSMVLKQMDIDLVLSDLPNQTNNAYCFHEEKAIVMGLAYLKRLAPRGEDMVAAIIAHELSHIAYRQKYRFYGLSKEEEIFADSYGVILRHRAGYNCQIYFRQNDIDRDVNYRVHPQDKIRSLIMKRVASSFDTRNQAVTPFKVDFPAEEFITDIDRLLRVSNNNYPDSSQRIVTDLGVMRDDKHKNDTANNEFLNSVLALPVLKAKYQSFLKLIDFTAYSPEQLLELYDKVCQSADFKNDMSLMTHFRDAWTYMCFRDEEDVLPGLLKKLDKKVIEETQKEFAATKPAYMMKRLEKYLDVRFRFRDVKNRQTIYDMYAKSFLDAYGPDDGSNEYGAILKEELNALSGTIHPSDVTPVAHHLSNQLKITNNNVAALYDFIKRNTFEPSSVRTETLLTECLLNSRQAQMTLEYLTGIRKKAFEFEGVYNKETGVKEYSYITASGLKEIRDNWDHIPPSKRAGLFCLLMENLGADDNMRKLDMFVDKKSKENKIYGQLMHTYIKTYDEDQQPYVIATLVSLKDRHHPFGYEDYFKTMLQHSGIDGRRVHDALYQTKSAECVEDMYRNASPLYRDNNIIFENLHRLGQETAGQTDEKLATIGRRILTVTAKKRVPTYAKER